MKRIVVILVVTLLGGLFALCGLAEESEPGILPTGVEYSDVVRGWEATLMNIDWQTLLGTAKEQVPESTPEEGFLASEVLLDGITGPFFVVDTMGNMKESASPFSEVFAYFFEQSDRWEELAAANALPVFMVAERQDDRVIGNYSGDVTVSVSVYRLYVIDGQGTLLGWDEIVSKGSAPYLLKSSDPRFFDQNPYPAYLDTMRYVREMMLVEDGVLTAYRSIPPADLILPEGITAIDAHAFEGQKTLERVVLPTTLEYIGSWAFYECTSLTEVVFGNALADIGPYAFGMCKSLETVVLPDSLRRIGDSAFRNCDALAQVTLNEGLERIESSAFYLDTALESIVLPSSLLSIGYGAFDACWALADIEFQMDSCRIDSCVFEDTPWLNAQEGDYVIVSDSLIDYRGEAATFSVPEGVRHVSVRIADERLQSLVLPEGVQSVGGYAFMDCENLADITFPQSLTRVGYEAFDRTAWSDAMLEPTVVGGGVFFQPYVEGWGLTIPEGVVCVTELRGDQLPAVIYIPDSCLYFVAEDVNRPSVDFWILHIPESVQEIDYDAFGDDGAVDAVYCAPGSVAERWAKERGIKVVYE